MAPFSWPVERRRAVSVREKDAGNPDSRSDSELNVNVPSRLDDWSDAVLLAFNSVPSLMRGRLALSNQDSVFVKLVLTERELELKPWLPPNVRFCTPLAPSESTELTRTRPDGSCKYGSP